jgi:TM2 domain-containing membrane protein YozV
MERRWNVKPEIKAALLSAVLFPGSGQMYLKRYMRGLVMMILVFIGIGIIIAMAVMRALESLDKVQTAGGIVDLNAISKMATASSQQNSPYYQLILLLIGCCWILSVVDAYRLGKRKSPTDAQGNVNHE